MRHIIVFLVCLGGIVYCQAQTRKLAHRSHSGQPATFAMLMDEDHAGAYTKMPDPERYNLEPFITKIRKHYESQAKKAAKEENPAVEVKPASFPTDSTNASVPKELPAPATEKPKKSARNGQSPSASTIHTEKADAAEVEPFALAKAELSTEHPSKQSSKGMGLWWLMGALLLTVGPGVYWAAGKKV